jgi:hypothetical protein
MRDQDSHTRSILLAGNCIQGHMTFASNQPSQRDTSVGAVRRAEGDILYRLSYTIQYCTFAGEQPFSHRRFSRRDQRSFVSQSPSTRMFIQFCCPSTPKTVREITNLSRVVITFQSENRKYTSQ